MWRRVHVSPTPSRNYLYEVGWGEAVVIPLGIQQCLRFQRNLVYTGITRGKRLVVVVGQRRALGMAVRNNRTEQRFSGLLARLAAPGWGALSPGGGNPGEGTGIR